MRKAFLEPEMELVDFKVKENIMDLAPDIDEGDADAGALSYGSDDDWGW